MMNRKINAVVILSSVLVLGFLPINVKAGSWENESSNSGPGVALQKEEKKQKETKENVFGWIKDPATSGWWYKNPDGTHPKNSWMWIDGDKNGLFECYFFDYEGWMMSKMTTPDGYTVDETGAWIKDGQVQRRTEEELKNPKVEEIKKEEKPKAGEGTGSASTDPAVPIHIPEPKEVGGQAASIATSNYRYFFDGGLAIDTNKKDGDSVGGFIPDEKFEELAHYARSKGFTMRHKSPDTRLWIDDKLYLYYSFPRNYNINDPRPNMAHAEGRIYNGEKYVELHLWMDEGNNYGTYTVRFYNGSGFTYRERAMHTKAYSIAEMKEAIDYAAGHSILRN